MSRTNTAVADQRTLSYKRSTRLKSIGMNIILIIVTIFMLTPLLWMLSTAFSPNTMIPPAKLLPHDFTFQNFADAWFFPREIGLNDQLTMGTFLMNSLIVTVLITIGGIICDSLAAYVLAFKEFPGKNLLIFLALATLMIPSYVTLVPQYIIISKMKWLNTYQAQIVPFLASGMGITLFRSHFLSVSKELVESAKIDGASSGQVLTKITLPLLKPMVVYTLITSMIGGLQMFDIPFLYHTAAGDIKPKSADVINRRANKLAAVGATEEAAEAAVIAKETIAEEAKMWAEIEAKKDNND